MRTLLAGLGIGLAVVGVDIIAQTAGNVNVEHIFGIGFFIIGLSLWHDLRD